MNTRKSAPEVSIWPLVFAVALLAVGAVLSLRTGKGGVAVVLAGAAVGLAGVGVFLRRPPAPRVRRVFVPDEEPTVAVVRLDTSRYLSSSALPGLPRRSSDATG